MRKLSVLFLTLALGVSSLAATKKVIQPKGFATGHRPPLPHGSPLRQSPLPVFLVGGVAIVALAVMVVLRSGAHAPGPTSRPAARLAADDPQDPAPLAPAEPAPPLAARAGVSQPAVRTPAPSPAPAPAPALPARQEPPLPRTVRALPTSLEATLPPPPPPPEPPPPTATDTATEAAADPAASRVAEPAAAPAVAEAVVDAPAYPSEGFRKPRLAQAGCITGSLRVPRDVAGLAGESATVRFAVDAEGAPSRFQLLSGPADPRVGAAIWSAVQRCQFLPGTDAQGRPALLWLVVPLRFAAN